MLAEDFLREGLVVAEDVPDPPLRPDPIRRAREAADAREEVNVRDFLMSHDSAACFFSSAFSRQLSLSEQKCRHRSPESKCLKV